GLIDGDVEPGMADGIVRAGEAPAVAERGEDADADQRADTEQVAHQRAAAGLAAGEGAQPAVQRRQLGVEMVDRTHAGLDEHAPGRRQLGLAEARAAGARAGLGSAWDALVVELRLHALLPGGALVDERLA